MKSTKNRRFHKFTGNHIDLERRLISRISETGKEQIKERRKAGLSVFYLKEGIIVEVKPDRTEIKGKEIGSRWVTLDRKNRTLVLK